MALTLGTAKVDKVISGFATTAISQVTSYSRARNWSVTCRLSKHNEREDEPTSIKGSRLRDHQGQHPFSGNRKTWRGSDPCSRSLSTVLDGVDGGWWDPGGI